METGVFVTFLGKLKHLKNIDTRSGKPFCVGQISAFQSGVGYINLPFKAFGDTANEIMNIGEAAFVEGEGALALHSRDKSKMEVTIEAVEISDYTPPQNNKKPRRQQEKQQETQQEKSEPKDDIDDFLSDFDIDEDDLPF